MLDGTVVIDAGVITGATSITSTTFVGNLTGNADTVTTISDPLLLGDGSSSAPTYSFASDSLSGMYLTGNEVRISGGVPTIFTKEASTTIKAGTAGGYKSSFQVDDDAPAGNTRMLVWDVDNGVLERVSVGSANSGGSGFKLLRIAN